MKEACREHDSFEGAAVHVALVGFAERADSFHPRRALTVSHTLQCFGKHDCLGSVRPVDRLLIDNDRRMEVAHHCLIDPGQSLWAKFLAAI